MPGHRRISVSSEEKDDQGAQQSEQNIQQGIGKSMVHLHVQVLIPEQLYCFPRECNEKTQRERKSELTVAPYRPDQFLRMMNADDEKMRDRHAAAQMDRFVDPWEQRIHMKNVA